MAVKFGIGLAKKVVSAGLGIAVGLFVGILILGTLVQVIFSLIFGWEDSAPEWGRWTEGVIIAGVTAASLYFSVKWFIGPKKES